MSPLGRAFLFLSLVASVLGAEAYTNYDNVWVNPDKAEAGAYASSITNYSQQTIVQWAQQLSAQGPWSVVNGTVTPPSGNMHDYVSWAPCRSSWPNCSNVHNTTALTPQQVWVECNYYTRDGLFNPDYLQANDSGHFTALADTVLYNALAWSFNKSESSYAEVVASFLEMWFINPATAMNPNLNYAQLERGPNGQVGDHTGVLDLKCMSKIVSGLLILKKGGAPQWTTSLDTALTNWTNTYIKWLTTDELALEERASTNNHGSYYFNQLASLQIYVGDNDGALSTLQTYFNSTYQNQINSTGDQPFEAIRTRPFHYRCYNLAAMITNARLAEYLGWDVWNLTTKAGTTIKDALDFTMTVNPGNESVSELWIQVADVAAAYGDPDNKYAAFLSKSDPLYPESPYFYWDQPLSNSDFVANATDGPVPPSPSTPIDQKNPKSSANALQRHPLAVVVGAVFGGLILLL